MDRPSLRTTSAKPKWIARHGAKGGGRAGRISTGQFPRPKHPRLHFSWKLELLTQNVAILPHHDEVNH